MNRIDRYLLRELWITFAATFLVLLMVSLSGLMADLLSKIARGKVPAALLLSQLGLRLVDVLPLMLPLGLFLGVLMAVSRLYRDSEMAVLAAAGIGPRRLLRPLAGLVLPVAAAVGVASLWGAPAALRLSKDMIDNANRSLLVAGLEPGRFVELPGRHSVVYLADMSPDGSEFRRLFVASERDDRIDIVTAEAGELYSESLGEERYLGLDRGFRVEGPLQGSEFRMMRFERNDIRVPDSEPSTVGTSERRDTLADLWRARGEEASAELHWRVGAPLAALILGLLALPMARQSPRAARYGRLLVALLIYLVYLNFLMIGRSGLEAGWVPALLGLWWVHGPVLFLALVLFWGQERPYRVARP